MPTPVTTARQCLTEEAARVLDDAVSVARRRSHTQTTSLHAVSALLSLPSSTLRESCTRARNSAYPLRLQFRALELSVGVSLDRLPCTKTLDEPPVSNSLMAAIKRSQANQRRHPETFQLYKNQSAINSVKVELKHFILSILDDPIVNRVFVEAGFRSYDVKLSILRRPPPPPISRSRCPPPLFLCNFSDWSLNVNRLFSGDENSKRIVEVLVKKKERNPLLIGFSAKDALTEFIKCVQRGKCKGGFLPGDLSVICIEKEICEFVREGGSEENMGFNLKLREVSDRVERCRGSGVVVSYGGLEVFVDGGLVESVKYVVLQLSYLVKLHAGKLWLIGAVGSCESYTEFLERFPLVGNKWDLHLLPITSSKASPNGGSYSKTSLLGSFVPFGGFFPTPSEFESITRCELCNEKYEQEVSIILKGGSTISVADPHSPSLSSWLQKDESDTIKRLDSVKAKDEAELNAKLIGLQRKWNGSCQRLHRTQSSQRNILQVRPQASILEGFKIDADSKESNENGLGLPPDHTSSSFITSVTTDLGLGTLYASSEQVKATFQDRLQSFSVPDSAEIDRVSNNASNCITLSSSCSGPDFVGQFDEKDFKNVWRVLSEQVDWQDEAIRTISQIVSRCRTGHGRRRGSNHRRDIWLSFLGPDRVGKQKIASALAEIVFGNRESLISVDLNSDGDGISWSNSIIERQGFNSSDLKFRGKTVVDYIGEELKSRPHSVVLLENIERADILVQNRLSRAIRIGKFIDSHGREISLDNMIFVTTSSITKVNNNLPSGKEPPEFSEEIILGAKLLQMQFIVGSVTGDATSTNGGSNVFIMGGKENSVPVSVNKRKLIDMNNSSESFEMSKRAHKELKSCLDLNLPVEEMEEGNNDHENSKEWLVDFYDQVDEKVGFKPFDFDALAEEVLKKIVMCFNKTVGVDVRLEIDQEVMVQLLAATWVSDKKRAVEDWIEEVLCWAFKEAERKHHLTTRSTVKLVAVEGLPMEEQAPNVCLPAKIVLH